VAAETGAPDEGGSGGRDVTVFSHLGRGRGCVECIYGASPSLYHKLFAQFQKSIVPWQLSIET